MNPFKHEKILFFILLAACLALSGYFITAMATSSEGSRTDPASSPLPSVGRNPEDKPAPDRDLSAYTSILERGLFGESGDVQSPTNSGAGTTYRLMGTLESGPVAGAVLDDGTGVQVFYRVNEKLPDDSRIVKVGSDQIVLKRSDGTTITVRIEEATEIVNAEVKSGREAAVYQNDRVQSEPEASKAGGRAFPRRGSGRRARYADAEE